MNPLQNTSNPTISVTPNSYVLRNFTLQPSQSTPVKFPKAPLSPGPAPSIKDPKKLWFAAVRGWFGNPTAANKRGEEDWDSSHSEPPASNPRSETPQKGTKAMSDEERTEEVVEMKSSISVGGNRTKNGGSTKRKKNMKRRSLSDHGIQRFDQKLDSEDAESVKTSKNAKKDDSKKKTTTKVKIVTKNVSKHNKNASSRTSDLPSTPTKTILTATTPGPSPATTPRSGSPTASQSASFGRRWRSTPVDEPEQHDPAQVAQNAPQVTTGAGYVVRNIHGLSLSLRLRNNSGTNVDCATPGPAFGEVEMESPGKPDSTVSISRANSGSSIKSNSPAKSLLPPVNPPITQKKEEVGVVRVPSKKSGRASPGLSRSNSKNNRHIGDSNGTSSRPGSRRVSIRSPSPAEPIKRRISKEDSLLITTSMSPTTSASLRPQRTNSAAARTMSPNPTTRPAHTGSRKNTTPPSSTFLSGAPRSAQLPAKPLTAINRLSTTTSAAQQVPLSPTQDYVAGGLQPQQYGRRQSLQGVIVQRTRVQSPSGDGSVSGGTAKRGIILEEDEEDDDAHNR